VKLGASGALAGTVVNTMEVDGLREVGMQCRDGRGDTHGQEGTTTVFPLLSPFSCPSLASFSPFQPKEPHRAGQLYSWDGKDPFFLTLGEIQEFLRYTATFFIKYYCYQCK